MYRKNQDNKMAFYENVFVLRQNLTTAQVSESIKKYENIVSELHGEITKTENWGLRNLAYVIKKNKRGHYILFQLNCDVACMKELNRKLSLDEDVIRHMILKIEKLSDTPSPILNQKDDNKNNFKKNDVDTSVIGAEEV